MRWLFLLSLIAGCFFIAAAQIKTKTLSFDAPWVSGKVLLETGDSVNCMLRYNPLVSEGLLEILEGENILTLSVRDVKGFQFFDEKKGKTRSFYSLALNIDKQYKREFFLEHVYGNVDVSILSHKTMGLPYDYMSYSKFMQKKSLINRRYLLNLRTGEVYHMSKENALNLMHGKRSEILSYIHQNKIKFKNVADYVSVFEYSNSLAHN